MPARPLATVFVATALLWCPAALAEASAAGWDGKFFIQSPDQRSRLEVGGRVQVLQVTDIPEEGDAEARILIRRARLSLGGHVFTPDLRYKLQADFGRGDVELLDIWADYRITEGLHVRAGQWKRPFSRQQLTSSGKLILVDRAITNGAFASGRDLGVALHNGYEKSPPFEWAIGVFNGTGIGGRLTGAVEDGEITGGGTSNVPDAFEPALVARLGYNHGDPEGYSEADLDGGPLRFGLGGSLLAAFDHDGGDDGRVEGQIDGVLKASGFAASGAVYVAFRQDGSAWSDQGHAATGFHLQASQVLGERWAPAIRYARVAREGTRADADEATAGLTVFLFGGHAVKWQTDASLLREGERDDWRVRTQLQAAF